MSFIPGKLVHSFRTKSGKEAQIRAVTWEDVDAMTEFVNVISAEDTFVTFSGEVMSIREEASYLASVFVASELGNFVKLCCFIDERLVGICDVRRELSQRTRGEHIGIFGLMVHKDYRSEGIGRALSEATILEAQKEIKGLKLICLQCVGSNTKALNLYEKLGFAEYGKLPKGSFFHDEYVDEVLMVLPLPKTF